MNKVIYKYPLSNQVTMLPVGANVLAVQMQFGQLTMWAEVDPDAPKEERHFVVYGTGHEMLTVPQKYIGTVQQDQFVWHAYEILKKGSVDG